MDILNILLPIIYIMVGCALVWLLIELSLAVRKTKKVVVDLKDQLDPTLANVEKITTEIPPMMEHLQLTIDAANLEVLRVDEILSDVADMTNAANKAIGTVDAVANAPVELVNALASKIRGKFGGKDASSESIKLGESKAVANGELPQENAISNLVDATQGAVDNIAKKIVKDVEQDTDIDASGAQADSDRTESDTADKDFDNNQE